jgi:hypothetical protein
MPKMPVLPVDKMVADLDDWGEKLIRAAFNRRTGALRATKPFRRIDYDAGGALFKACANYVWRMLCFDFCGFSPHNCLPVCADWDIGAVFYRREDSDREMEKRGKAKLDATIERAESVLPASAQRGLMQWGRAWGMVGTDSLLGF